MEFMMKEIENKDYAIAKGLSEIEELRSTKRALQETLEELRNKPPVIIDNDYFDENEFSEKK